MSSTSVVPIVVSEGKSPIVRDVCTVLPHLAPTIRVRFSGPCDFSNLTPVDKFVSQLNEFMQTTLIEARKRAEAKTMRFLITNLSQLLWSLMYVSRNSPKRPNLVVRCKPKALAPLWIRCILGSDPNKSQEYDAPLSIFGFHAHVSRWFDFLRQGLLSGPETQELHPFMRTLFLMPNGTCLSGLELFLRQIRETTYANQNETIDLVVFQRQQINFAELTDCFMLHLS